jgi:DNA-binding response OmpR family regulator
VTRVALVARCALSDGLILITSFRELTDAPILICSALHTPIDRVLRLKLGAFDFMSKPFDLDEPQARVEALLAYS